MGDRRRRPSRRWGSGTTRRRRRRPVSPTSGICSTSCSRASLNNTAPTAASPSYTACTAWWCAPAYSGSMSAVGSTPASSSCNDGTTSRTPSSGRRRPTVLARRTSARCSSRRSVRRRSWLRRPLRCTTVSRLHRRPARRCSRCRIVGEPLGDIHRLSEALRLEDQLGARFVQRLAALGTATRPEIGPCPDCRATITPA